MYNILLVSEYFEHNFPNLRLKAEDYKGAEKFLKSAYLSSESNKVFEGSPDYQEILVKLLETAKEQGKEANNREEKWNEQRRLIIKSTLIGTPLFILAGGLGFWGWNTFSPDARRKADEAQQVKQSEIIKNMKTLGTKYSALSQYGWQIKYNEFNPDVSYKPIDNQRNAQWMIPNEGYIVFPWVDYNTSITVSAVEGSVSPKLTVVSNYGREDWLMRSEEDKNPEPSIDTRVVVFDSPKTKSTKYLSISPTNTTPSSFKAVEMQAIYKKTEPIDRRSFFHLFKPSSI